MARYNRIKGPAADFEVAAAFVTIPGISISRLYDEGELLILFQYRATNNLGVATNNFARVLLDGVPVTAVGPMAHLPAGTRETVSGMYLESIQGGLHTVELQSSGDAAVGDIIDAGGVDLIVIQLPVWDSSVNIVSL